MSLKRNMFIGVLALFVMGIIGLIIYTKNDTEQGKGNEAITEVINEEKTSKNSESNSEESFTTPPDPDKIVTDPRGGIYPVNQLFMILIGEATRTDAEELASIVHGKIIGFLPSTNTYQLEVPTDTIAELDVVRVTLDSDPRVEGTFPNGKFKFD